MQVSAVTDQTRGQEVSANAGDFDDDEGDGLVSHLCNIIWNFMA